MIKTQCDVKKVLAHCADTGMACHMCSYEIRCLKVVRGKPIMQDALALIQQLETDNAEKDKRIAELEQELEAVKQERDAAVAALESIATGRESKCDHCARKSDGCRSICWGTRWQWRGVCPENTEVKDGNQADNA